MILLSFLQVWLLDFGHSSRSSDTEAQALELEELIRLFRESSDSGASGRCFAYSIRLDVQ